MCFVACKLCSSAALKELTFWYLWVNFKGTKEFSENPSRSKDQKLSSQNRQSWKRGETIAEGNDLCCPELSSACAQESSTSGG
eukprot:1044694-Amphidinium_carterae.1